MLWSGKTDVTVAIVGNSNGSAQNIGHDGLGYRDLCMFWWPNSSIYEADETWLHPYEMESRRQRTEFKCLSATPHPKLSAKLTLKTTTKKITLILFWYIKGSILTAFSAMLNLWILIRILIYSKTYLNPKLITNDVYLCRKWYNNSKTRRNISSNGIVLATSWI